MYSESNFIKQLKKLFPFLGIETNAELADILNISRQVISFWFTRKQPSDVKYFTKLANLFGLKIDYFFLDVQPEDYIREELKVIKKRINTVPLIDPQNKEIIVFSRDLKTQKKYRRYCRNHSIKYHEATSIHKLESELKICDPDCVYMDSELTFEIDKNINVCLI